jgi:hypothetical protein
MIYALVVIAISAANIQYSDQSDMHGNSTAPSNSTGNSTSNGTGCNIYDIHQVSYNYAIGHIVLALITILGCMCVQTSKKEFNPDECHTVPCEYWLVVSSLAVMSILTIITAEAGVKTNEPYYKEIALFQATGCNPEQLGVIYASMFVTGLPAMLFGLVLGLFIIGAIIYWTGYAIISWLRTFACCANLCRDCGAACDTAVEEENHQPRPTNISYSARTRYVGRPQSLNAIWTGNTIRYSELYQQPSTTIVVQHSAYSESETK